MICAALSGKHQNLQPAAPKLEAALAGHLPDRSVNILTGELAQLKNVYHGVICP
jgi:hypothetical protein